MNTRFSRNSLYIRICITKQYIKCMKYKLNEKKRINKRKNEYYAYYIFSNLLCFASLLAHFSSILNNFNCNGENWILGEMKPRIYRRHPINMHLGRATIVEGISKQNAQPFKVCKKTIMWMCVWLCVSLICILRLPKLLVM